ncbi:E3 ubiquitin-protein ligase PPP1R11 [Lingula anatina]|uniref:E3 ubiquitin-protein ligase PPP1R11 n=1 Tax=Lingula anatina TaxID=7574 RepID=A0A1S3J0I0_LINAN|nr:E3 ubiquitin-protein ligase PPP1R11 [Lingula anatina]XP_013403953.1 E3 ubiquitin-protein ligase PPP1R11 [Lingula anatina]|eukprot:XP_013403952.1 E3 ubiquitin-protein ligase PPP1R11 [Lingula anatina]
MAEGKTSGQTVAVTQTVTDTGAKSPSLVLKLKKPKNDKKVKWTTGTVDNEHMGKKKSKCCCIYEKPKIFGEDSSSDSDSDGECDHCRGHTPKDFTQKGDPGDT